MRRVLVCAVLLACAGCGATRGCTVDEVAQQDGVGMNVTNCGDFTLGAAAYTDEAMAAAQACVLSAVAGGSSFRLVYDTPGSDGGATLHAAFTGRVVPSGLQLESYAGGGSGAGAIVSGRACTSITITASCTPHVGVPCLTCEGDGASALVCQG